jgi:putative sterol carrier protein
MEFVGRNNESWAERYRVAGDVWCDAEAAAQLLEDCKSAVMAQWQTELGDIPVNRAEQTVKASARWRDYIQDAVDARKAANLAKVRLETIKMKAMEYQAKEANSRTEMRIMGR